MDSGFYLSLENLLESADSVTIDNLDASTPVTNAYDDRLLTVVAANGPDVPLIIRFDLGAAKPIRGFFFGETNMPDGSTVNYALSAVSTSASDVLMVSRTPVSLPLKRKQLMYHLTNPLSARYGRIEIHTPGDTGVTLELGWAWVARADWEPPVLLDLSPRFVLVPRSIIQTSKGGVDFHDIQRGFYQSTFSSRFFEQQDAMQTALDIDGLVENYAAVLYVPHRRNTNMNLDRETLLGKFVQLDPIEEWAVQSSGDGFYTKSYVLREALSAKTGTRWTPPTPGPAPSGDVLLIDGTFDSILIDGTTDEIAIG